MATPDDTRLPVELDPSLELPTAREFDPARIPEPLAQLSYRVDGEIGEIDLGQPGLMLLPMPRHGEAFISVLSEAFDRARAGGRRRVGLSSGAIELQMECTEHWPAGDQLPSMVFGGGIARADETHRPGLTRQPWLRRAMGQLTPEQLEDLRQYPGRRRSLAALKRSRESELVRQDDMLRSRVRVARSCAAGAFLALGGVVLGVIQQIAVIQFTCSALFFALAGLQAYERFSRTRMAERRDRLELRVEQAEKKAAELDAQARESARRIGFDDPWEAAARAQEVAIEPESASSQDETTIFPRAREMADLAGLSDVVWPDFAQWSMPDAGAKGWPADVSLDQEATAADRLLAAAHLVERVERLLPERLPLLLWDPWSHAHPRERAQMLMALAKMVPTRRVLAVVESD